MFFFGLIVLIFFDYMKEFLGKKNNYIEVLEKIDFDFIIYIFV